jgi:hypothetical protein
MGIHYHIVACGVKVNLKRKEGLWINTFRYISCGNHLP